MNWEPDEYLHFFEHSMDLLCIAGIDGYFKRLNVQWQKVLGHSNDELLAKPFIDFVHPDDVPATLEKLDGVRAGEPVISFENRYRCRDGTYRWFLWQATPAQGKGVTYAIARDITEQKAKALRQDEARDWQNAILDSADLTIISTRVDGIIKTINQGALRKLGYTAEEVVGKVTPALIHDGQEVVARSSLLTKELGREIKPGFEAFVAKARDNVADENEWTYIRKDGSRFPVSLTVTALRNHEGEITGFLGIGRDISERKKAELELQRSNRDLEQFAYVASHDLHEPLRMVTSYLQLLQRYCNGTLDEEATSFLNTALDGAKRMRCLIQDLLAYSRVGSRGHTLIPTDIERVLKDTITNLKIAVETTRAIITVDPLPMVLADCIQIGQLFQNLILNALKFCGETTPRIHISATQTDRFCTFSVADNGIGIEAKSFERIFEIFQRLHSREEYEGTGIGLAVCKRIVERHNGEIWLESILGKGTTFYFKLPAINENNPEI